MHDYVILDYPRVRVDAEIITIIDGVYCLENGECFQTPEAAVSAAKELMLAPLRAAMAEVEAQAEAALRSLRFQAKGGAPGILEACAIASVELVRQHSTGESK